MSWGMRFFVCVILLVASSTHQATGENNTARVNGVKYQQWVTDDNCVCHDGEGRMVNPYPVRYTNGSARFKKRGSDNFWYSFNPCGSFSIGPKASSECLADVSLCKWKKGGAYENIGRKSTVRCGFDTEYRTPQLEYSNNDQSSKWTSSAYVILKCDPLKKSREQATFEIIHHDKKIKIFLLSHNCLCAGQCPLDKDKDYSALSRRVDSLQYCVIVGFALVFIGALFHYGKPVWQFLKQNDNEENRPLLNERQEEVVDYTANHSNKLNAATPKKYSNYRSSKNRDAATLC